MPTTHQRRRLVTSALLTLPVWSASTVAAEAWPSKPIRLIVPYIAGSAPDNLARALAEKLGPALGTSIMIDNRPGAGGNIGFDLVAKAPADGYTLCMGTSGLAINPHLYRKLPYDALRDFTWLNLSFSMPHALIVRPDSGIQSTSELIAKLKAAPNQFNFASGGNGTGAHLSAELFKLMAKVQAQHVPYKGAPEIVASVLSGDTLFGFPTLSTVAPLAQSGKLRILAVTSEQRNSALPDVPAVSEAVAQYDVISWIGLVGPAKLPTEVTQRLERDLAKIFADRSFKANMQAKGADAIGLPQAQFSSYFQKDYQRWRMAVEASGAKVD